MASPRAGALVGGRYRLKSPLAAGGMGAVWLASHVDLETEVAIKLVSRAYAKRADLLERFRREARSAAQLKTPHVVQILDYGVDDGAPYIAMELLDGEDLEALLERESALPPARVLAIVKPICKALAVAHAAGIVHRDLKPSNIFLARIADEEVVKIVDFGIAKELRRDAEYATGSQVLGSRRRADRSRSAFACRRSQRPAPAAASARAVSSAPHGRAHARGGAERGGVLVAAALGQHVRATHLRHAVTGRPEIERKPSG